MAVYYKWIKGCAPGSNLTSGAWSYISWGTGTDTTKTEVMPQLRISTGKNDTATSGSLGYFLTSGMPTPTIDNKWIFKNVVELKTGLEVTGGLIELPNGCYLQTSGQKLIFNSPSSAPSVFEADILLAEDVAVGNVLSVGFSATTDSSTTAINSSGITTKGYCEATYFNALSDKRAKENIKPVEFSALEVVNQTPVYSFNYKDKTENVPGVIAQDLLKLDLPVELVNNINASGENGDYMSIKESKLIYILWKAIQEQQAEIEALKKQINN